MKLEVVKYIVFIYSYSWINIYIYIYILKQMPALNAWHQRYGLENTHNLLKAHVFLFFLEALSMCLSICLSIYLSVYLSIYLPIIDRLLHPPSEESEGQEACLAPFADKQTRNYDTKYSNHYPSLSTLRPKGLSRSKMKWWAI